MSIAKIASFVEKLAIAALVLALAAMLFARAKTVEARLVTPYPVELQKLTGKVGTVETGAIEFVVLDRSVLLKQGDDVLIDSTKGYPLQTKSATLACGAAMLGAIAVGLFSRILIIRARRAQPPSA